MGILIGFKKGSRIYQLGIFMGIFCLYVLHGKHKMLNKYTTLLKFQMYLAVLSYLRTL